MSTLNIQLLRLLEKYQEAILKNESSEKIKILQEQIRALEKKIAEKDGQSFFPTHI